MPRAGLDREAVAKAAARVSDRYGLDHLTLAGVAAELGVRTPSLYNHTEGLGGLRRDLALLGTQELTARLTRATVGKTRCDAVVALASAARIFAHERPGLYAACLVAPNRKDKELRRASEELTSVVLDVLASFGLQGDDALHATRGLRALLHGFVTLEAAGGFGLPLDLDESYARLIRWFVDGLNRNVSVPNEAAGARA
jgi:AcrR family transcriptional regulator